MKNQKEIATAMLKCIETQNYEFENFDNQTASIILLDENIPEEICTITFELDFSAMTEIMKEDRNLSFYGLFDLSKGLKITDKSTSAKFVHVWKNCLNVSQKSELVRKLIESDNDVVFKSGNLTKELKREIMLFFGLFAQGSGVHFCTQQYSVGADCHLYLKNKPSFIMKNGYKDRKPKEQHDNILRLFIQLCDFKSEGIKGVPNKSGYEYSKGFRRTGRSVSSVATMKARYQANR